MGFLPIFVEMKRRPCLVVGGGRVAERKIAALLENGAKVKVVSPDVTESIARWSKQGLLELAARNYRAGDTVGFRIVFAATDNPALNDVVYRECRNADILINSADDPEHCDFILPSVLRRADLTVAVSTGGHSPALARTIREELEDYFTSEYESLVKLAGEVRLSLQEKGIQVSFEAWKHALSGDVRQLLMRGQIERARATLLRELDVSPDAV